MIAVPCDGSFPARAVLERDGIPFVVIDRPLDDGGQVDTIAVDNVAAAYEGTQRLLELGHRQPAGRGLLNRHRQYSRAPGGIDAAIIDVAGARADVVEAGNEVAEIAAAVPPGWRRRRGQPPSSPSTTC